MNKFEYQDLYLTWSNYEVICNDYKDISILEGNNDIPCPELKVLAFSTKILHNNSSNRNNKEIIAISGNVYNYDLDSADFKNEASFIILKEENIKSDSNFNHEMNDVSFCHNEAIFLNKFFIKLSTYDPDVLVAHNLYKDHLEEIISRVNINRISENWSKLGRIRRVTSPKYVTGGGFISNLNQMRYFTAGRIICDTVLSLQDIIRENNYTIDFLANRHLISNSLHENKDIISVNDTEDLLNYGLQALEESRVCFELMNKFWILQLNKQLSNISGSLWIKSLQNSRVERCEMLLLHEMKKKSFILPDKFNKSNYISEDFPEDVNEDKKNKLNNYEGGLVLEPKAGFYDQIILLLDFNSLYPSIIQQYNICFTTVGRKSTQNFNESNRNNFNEFHKLNNTNQAKPNVETIEENDENDLNIIRKTESIAILPFIIESLIKQRNLVKEDLKNEKDSFKKSMLNIQQTALKLSANSLYGYLGYKSSRFYSKTIAALITKKGRDILKETVTIVKTIQNINSSCFLDIIYGDTDSIMVNTLTNDLRKALEIGHIIKQKINDKDKILKIEIDSVYKSLLHLKKKKYAGLKYENAMELLKNNFQGDIILTKECKGLDMIRRDWCDLSKETGSYILDLLLNSELTKEDIITQIYDYLKELNIKIEKNLIDLEKYVISKQLVKNVEEYNNALLPHIRVAKRLRERGDQSITNGTMITYLICRNNKEKIQSKKVSERAYHLKEVRENKNLEIDIEWYKESQILMSINRLCKHIKV